MSKEMVYVVSDWADQIKLRPAKAIAKQDAWNAKWNRNCLPTTTFATREEAGAFIIARAEAEVEACEAKLARAVARLRKCRRKFAAAGEDR